MELNLRRVKAVGFQKRKLSKEQKEVRSMKAKLPLAKPKKRGLENKTAQQLIPEADKWFSRYVRLRDSEYNGSEWVTECIDQCDRKMVVIDAEGKWKQGVDCGHYITRGVHSLRYREENTNAQSSYCNAWADKQGMIHGYEKGLALKYSEDTVKELKRLSKAPDAYKRLSKPDLLQVIADSKAYIKYTLEHK